jgi:hypothetical protein
VNLLSDSKQQNRPRHVVQYLCMLSQVHISSLEIFYSVAHVAIVDPGELGMGSRVCAHIDPKVRQ